MNDDAWKNALREHLTPEAIVMIESLLQMTDFYEPANAAARQTLEQVEHFVGVLLTVLPEAERERILAELEL